MGSIKNVVTEPIEGHEDYHMMVRVLFFVICAPLYIYIYIRYKDSG